MRRSIPQRLVRAFVLLPLLTLPMASPTKPMQADWRRIAAQYDASRVYASALSREVNLKQMQDRAPKLSTIEVRLKDMDRMGIDIQAVSPAPNQCAYWAEPGLGLEEQGRRLLPGVQVVTSSAAAVIAPRDFASIVICDSGALAPASVS